MEEFDLDRATEMGWAGFQSQLAEHLATTAEPLVVMPYGGDPESSPVLEIRPTGEGEDEGLHAELRAPGGSTWPEDERSRHMTALGWSIDPGRTTYLLDLPRSHAHLLAAAATDTLREVVGVPHPAFLDAGPLTPGAPPEDEQETAPVPTLDLDTALAVRTPQQLREAVDTTLHALLGYPPRHDQDGDVPILFGSALVYVRTADARPVVTVFAIPVQRVTDLDAARREVELFNRASVFVKFHLVARQVVASVSIPCLPFVPRHLVGMVELMGREIDRIDEPLALRVGGSRWIDLLNGAQPDAGAAPGTGGDAVVSGPGADDEDLPPELSAVLEMTGEGASPDPAAIAEVCHHDPELILELIRTAEERTIGWRATAGQARADGDADRVRAATGEMRSWRGLVRTLRAALRHVVTFGSDDG